MAIAKRLPHLPEIFRNCSKEGHAEKQDTQLLKCKTWIEEPVFPRTHATESDVDNPSKILSMIDGRL
jgi:hypothetical protein